MIRSKSFTFTVAGTGETLTNALSGIGERKRIIKRLRADGMRTSTAASPQHQAFLRAYKRTDQVVDARPESFVACLSSATTKVIALWDQPVDIPLDQGDGFQIGFYDASTSFTGYITMEYEDQ